MRHYVSFWYACVFFGWMTLKGLLNADYTPLFGSVTDRLEDIVVSILTEGFVPRNNPILYFLASLVLLFLFWYEKETDGFLAKKPDDPLNIRDKLK